VSSDWNIFSSLYCLEAAKRNGGLPQIRLCAQPVVYICGTRAAAGAGSACGRFQARPRTSGGRPALCHVHVNTAGLHASAAMGLNGRLCTRGRGSLRERGAHVGASPPLLPGARRGDPRTGPRKWRSWLGCTTPYPTHRPATKRTGSPPPGAELLDRDISALHPDLGTFFAVPPPKQRNKNTDEPITQIESGSTLCNGSCSSHHCSTYFPAVR
jgi:hypothetical protein